MSEGQGEPNHNKKDSKEAVIVANVPSDSPVTDPGHVRGGPAEAPAAGKFDGQRGKSSALKKSARYRSRSLSASSADSYSSTSYTGKLLPLCSINCYFRYLYHLENWYCIYNLQDK